MSEPRVERPVQGGVFDYHPAAGGVFRIVWMRLQREGVDLAWCFHVLVSVPVEKGDTNAVVRLSDGTPGLGWKPVQVRRIESLLGSLPFFGRVVHSLLEELAQTHLPDLDGGHFPRVFSDEAEVAHLFMATGDEPWEWRWWELSPLQLIDRAAVAGHITRAEEMIAKYTWGEAELG
jgi:hypothetical protein